jgi:hypothetical protein
LKVKLLSVPKRTCAKYKQSAHSSRVTYILFPSASVGAVAYVGKEFVEVKLLSVPKKDQCKILAIGAWFQPHVDIIPECFGTVTAGSTCCRG